MYSFDEFDMKTSDFKDIYRIFRVKLAVFFCQKPLKMNFGHWI